MWASRYRRQGIVYYGRYLPYFDTARVEYHRHLGQLYTSPDEERQFVMRATNIEYFAPAQFDDLIEVFIRVARIGRTSMTYDCAAYRVEDDVLMVTANQTLVLVDLDERAVPDPGLVPQEDRRVRGRRPRTLGGDPPTQAAHPREPGAARPSDERTGAAAAPSPGLVVVGGGPASIPRSRYPSRSGDHPPKG